MQQSINVTNAKKTNKKTPKIYVNVWIHGKLYIKYLNIFISLLKILVFKLCHISFLCLFNGYKYIEQKCYNK